MAENSEGPYVTVTKGIRISVVPEYSPDQSRPANSLYVYNYTITITNSGQETVQLLSRHWIIRDGFEHVEHVQGDGVVGKQPNLKPGESFTYTSSCPLQTPTGTMQGSYQMRSADNKIFNAQIGEFQLAHKSLLN